MSAFQELLDSLHVWSKWMGYEETEAHRQNAKTAYDELLKMWQQKQEELKKLRAEMDWLRDDLKQAREDWRYVIDKYVPDPHARATLHCEVYQVSHDDRAAATDQDPGS